MSDDLAALRLQLEWGADEAIGDVATDRFVQLTIPHRPLAIPHRPLAIPVTAPSPANARVTAPERAKPTADTIDALVAELAAFETCRLRDTATQTVRPRGDPAAKLMLIGDAPGSDDDRSGLAFSGAPGQQLDRVLASAGLNPETMLLTTMVPWRPPGGRPVTEPEVQLCLPFVHRLLAIVQPRHLLLMGGATVKSLTGRPEPVRRLRGNWLDVQIPQVEVTISALPFSPLDQWFASPNSKRFLWLDLLSLQKATTTT